MGIQIEQVSVKNLGPIHDFDEKLKRVNLIYGRNENGKTFLVEFIYRSLFKNLSLSLRSSSASGQVMVSGIEDRETQFSPNSKKKLEDFWVDTIPGLPGDFSKLLVVKGADLDLSSSSAAGLDDKILKEFLSGERLLEKIGSKIKNTESNATYENGKIIGKAMGLVKDYSELGARIKQIDGYQQDINMHISGGKRFELKQEIEALQGQQFLQEMAKKHLAFTLARQIASLKMQMDAIPDDQLSLADKLVSQYRQKESELQNKKKELEENTEKSKHYQWLDAAIIEYQRLISLENERKSRPGMVWWTLILISAALAIGLILFGQPYWGAALVVVSLVFGFIYMRGLGKTQPNDLQKEEIRKIEKDYQSNFGIKTPVGSAVLAGKLKELQPFHYSTGQIENDIKDMINKLNGLGQEIGQAIYRLTGSKIAPDEWQSTINTLQEKRRVMDGELRNTDNELSGLNIPEDEYREEPVEAQFSRSQLAAISDQLLSKKEELRAVEDELQQLKQAVCAITAANINIEWDDLIEKLAAKRCDVVKNYKSVTADVIARIKVTEALNDLRLIETARIEEGLVSALVSQALLSTTGHYDRIQREGGDIFISDQYGRYALKELSTGAREQVLLGLRIGFASRILAGSPLFLILDDAFQHSDWQRRERLVEKLFSLSEEGWQIIYFTMDDHIRKLFEGCAKNGREDNFQTIDLCGRNEINSI